MIENELTSGLSVSGRIADTSQIRSGTQALHFLRCRRASSSISTYSETLGTSATIQRFDLETALRSAATDSPVPVALPAIVNASLNGLTRCLPFDQVFSSVDRSCPV
jgi:hypothetical protein